MRQCILKYKECPLKRPLSGRAVRWFEIQVAKATSGQKNGSGEGIIIDIEIDQILITRTNPLNFS